MVKLTEKQEKFCKRYIELGNASEAYRQSYDCSKSKPEGVHVRACELLKNSNVRVRLEELKAAANKRHEITVDDLIKELEEARQVGKDKEQSAGMVAASMGKAKLLGLVVDKQQLSATHTVRNANELTDDELASIAAGSGTRTAE